MRDLLDRINESQRRIGAMCSERRPPRMSVPPNRERDDDLFICDALQDAAAEIARLREEREKLFVVIDNADPWGPASSVIGAVRRELARLQEEAARSSGHPQHGETVARAQAHTDVADATRTTRTARAPAPPTPTDPDLPINRQMTSHATGCTDDACVPICPRRREPVTSGAATR